MELLRLSKAAKRLGVHPMTLRQWAIDGKIPFTLVGRERRFSSVDVENMKRGGGPADSRPRREVLYVRVSGSSGQESSLAAQEGELRATAAGQIVKVVRDRGSGLREDRPGLNRVLVMVADDQHENILDDAMPPVDLAVQHPDLSRVRVASTGLAAWSAGPESIYLIDPLGNLVLAFPRDPDIKRMGNDLTRLLRASRIG